VSALKYRYNEIDGNLWTFKGLSSKAKHARPHKALTTEELETILYQKGIKSKHYHLLLGVSLLYDLGGRNQDLLQFTFAYFRYVKVG
jgi:hypothetical protein